MNKDDINPPAAGPASHRAGETGRYLEEVEVFDDARIGSLTASKPGCPDHAQALTAQALTTLRLWEVPMDFVMAGFSPAKYHRVFRNMGVQT